MQSPTTSTRSNCSKQARIASIGYMKMSDAYAALGQYCEAMRPIKAWVALIPIEMTPARHGPFSPTLHIRVTAPRKPSAAAKPLQSPAARKRSGWLCGSTARGTVLAGHRCHIRFRTTQFCHVGKAVHQRRQSNTAAYGERYREGGSWAAPTQSRLARSRREMSLLPCRQTAMAPMAPESMDCWG